ncbi:MAG: c-type cytochrome biogenesis protein CcmI [Methylococcales bacterium]|nr:c-type cytochrome biogenesis protein CcmI [Methylococcales bacterium]
MNLLFLLIAACLVLLAFLFILPPLWRQRPIAKATMNERNIAIAKQRLAELTEQLQSNVLSQAQYNEQRAELEQGLSDDLELTTQIEANPEKGQWMAYLLMLGVPVLAATLYWSLGTFNAIEPTPEMLASNKPTMPNQDAINKMVDGLAKKIQADPNNAEGWVMLGQSYKHLEKYAQSADAYAHAYQLLGDKPDVMLQYAEALSFANDEQITGKSADLVFKALALEPTNPNALWLAGMAKAQAGEFMAAKKLWTQLADSLPEGSEAQQETRALLTKIDSKIAEANNETGTKVVSKEAANAEKITPVSIASVDVQVSLAPELQAQTSPTDTVFIYAQALSGSPMPLAIVRKQVSDLPLAVNFTDAQAMTPTMKLSNFADVTLLARISKSGNAMKQTGDLIGVLEGVTVADKTRHTIVINSVVK